MRIDDAILSGSVLGSSAVVSLSGSFSGSFVGDGSRITNLPIPNYNPIVKISDFNAESGRAYIITSSTSTVTMTLPPSPQNGDSIKLANMDGRQTIITRNGNKIMSSADDLTLDVADCSFELIYETSLIGWTIIGSRSI